MLKDCKELEFFENSEQSSGISRQPISLVFSIPNKNFQNSGFTNRPGGTFFKIEGRLSPSVEQILQYEEGDFGLKAETFLSVASIFASAPQTSLSVAQTYYSDTRTYYFVAQTFESVAQTFPTVAENYGLVAESSVSVIEDYGLVVENSISVVKNSVAVVEDYGLVVENYGSVAENYESVWIKKLIISLNYRNIQYWGHGMSRSISHRDIHTTNTLIY